MTPNEPNNPHELDVTIPGMRFRARGLVPVLLVGTVLLAIVFKTDLTSVSDWIRLASR